MSEEPVQVQKRKKTFSTMFSPSTRLTLIYIVFFVWVALAIFAILYKADLYALATYFASGLPLILGYLWAQTSRPSMGEAAEILKNIKGGSTQTQNQNQNPSPYQPTYQPSYQQPSQIAQTSQVNQTGDVSIYSDDSNVELKVNQGQLATLLNIGYLNKVGDKYTFQKSHLDQVKSLLGGDIQDPNI